VRMTCPTFLYLIAFQQLERMLASWSCTAIRCQEPTSFHRSPNTGFWLPTYCSALFRLDDDQPTVAGRLID
jgi:hypothetical protein